jgi:hypothetical protein
LNDGVNEDESLEETGMEEGEVGKLAATHAVTHTNYGTGHLLAVDIDHVKKIATVIQPGSFVVLICVHVICSYGTYGHCPAYPHSTRYSNLGALHLLSKYP